MNKCIIYLREDNKISIIFPADCGISIEEIARKDVPAGAPYKIIDNIDLLDFEYQESWESDFSQPDGYGIGSEAWFAEKEAQDD